MSDKCYSGIDNLEVLLDAVHYNRFLVNEIVKAGRGATTAVDFGAGIGTFSTAFRSRGLSVICIEKDADLLDKLRCQGFKAYGSLNPITDGSQDYIFSLNVLEHIQDDNQSLKALFAKLKPGGRLLLYVPAFNVLFSSMDRKVGHYRRYSKSALIKATLRAGFTIERVTYVDSLGFFVTLAYKLIGNKQGDISPTAVKLYDRILFPISRMLDQIGIAYFLGKNLMVVAERPPAP
ncbi:MAG: class I SAM-dependent methyltransferase [bacterium]